MPKVVFVGLNQLPTLLINRHFQTMRGAMQQCVLDSDPMIEFHKLVGEGSYGKTYAACANQECKYVAKLVQLDNEQQQELFQRECDIATFASQRHFGPEVTKSILCTSSQGSHYAFGVLLMERFADHLDHLITSGKCTQANVKAICACVHSMHESGIWHTDLHRANIMYRLKAKGKMEFRVIDFGLAWPFFSPVPVLLRLTDVLSWMLGQHMVDEGKRDFSDTPLPVPSRQVVMNFLQQHYAPTRQDVELAFTWRIHDPSQQGVRNENWGPSATIAMYKYAASHLKPRAIEYYGIDNFMKIMPYLTSDHQHGQLSDAKNEIHKILENHLTELK